MVRDMKRPSRTVVYKNEEWKIEQQWPTGASLGNAPTQWAYPVKVSCVSNPDLVPTDKLVVRYVRDINSYSDEELHQIVNEAMEWF